MRGSQCVNCAISTTGEESSNAQDDDDGGEEGDFRSGQPDGVRKGGADRPYPAGEGPRRDRTDGESEAHGGNREPGPAPRNPGEKEDPEREGDLPRAAPEEVRGVKDGVPGLHRQGGGKGYRPSPEEYPEIGPGRDQGACQGPPQAQGRTAGRKTQAVLEDPGGRLPDRLRDPGRPGDRLCRAGPRPEGNLPNPW